jgi:Skp family chaperone for outer membrane proteins
MKRMALMLTAAIFTLSTAPAFAQMTPAQKDECVLASKNCTDQVDDIYKRMHRLNKEIKKGTKVYTPDELKKLRDKLQETDDLLKKLEQGGGS